MNADPHVPFLSCDWGTSSFRLRRISDGKIQREICEPHGVRSLYEQSIAEKKDRASLFAQFLRAKLSEIGGAGEGLPLIISGMASSTIGWRELPYATAPLSLDGNGLGVERFQWDKPAGLGLTLLISGLATADDVMRGEETQILGIMAAPERKAFAGRSVLILPGTHSKHVQIEGGSIRTFRTYMTGELFDILSQHSILRATVDTSGRIEASEAFREGARTARKRGLPGSLFSVRARAVLGKSSSRESAAFLSGLLIGSELVNLDGSAPVLIAGAGDLGGLYLAAIQEIAPDIRVHSLSADEVDAATVAAHRLILSRFA